MKKFFFLCTLSILNIFLVFAINPLTVINKNYTGITLWENEITGLIEGRLFESFDFSEDLIVISDETLVSSNPQVLVNANDDIVIIWQTNNGLNDIIQVKTYNPLVGWSDITTISDAGKNSKNPQIAISPTKYIAIWEEENINGHQIRGKIFENGSWSNYLDFTSNDKNYFSPKISINNSNNAILTWITTDNANTIIEGKTYIANAWSNTDILSDNQYSSINPAVIINENNYIVVLWQMSIDSVNHIYRKTYTTSWSNAEEISNNSLDSINPQISTADNWILASWESSDDDYSVIYSKIYSAKTELWGEILPVSELDQKASNHKNIIVDDGYAQCIWEEKASENINQIKACFYKLRYGWENKVTVSSSTNNSINPSICYNYIWVGNATWLEEEISQNIIQGSITTNPQSWSAPENLDQE